MRQHTAEKHHHSFREQRLAQSSDLGRPEHYAAAREAVVVQALARPLVSHRRRRLRSATNAGHVLVGVAPVFCGAP